MSDAASHCDSASSGYGGKDRRRSERQPHIVDAWVSSDASNDPAGRVEVTALNVSRHGVGFQTLKPLHLGAVHCVEIGFGPNQLLSQIRIVSCTPLGDGLFQVGAEFC